MVEDDVGADEIGCHIGDNSPRELPIRLVLFIGSLQAPQHRAFRAMPWTNIECVTRFRFLPAGIHECVRHGLHLGKDIFAGLKNLVGGELRAYTELLNESRNEALQRMIMQAHSMGANAIVNVRFATSNVASGASELFCYGTAVIVE